MLWAIVILVVLVGVAAFVMDWRDRSHGHRPGTGQSPDAGVMDERPVRPWGDYGSGPQ